MIRSIARFCLAPMLVGIASQVFADADDPPSRVARLAFVQGAVSFQPAGTDDWVAPGLNRPLTTGDKLWSDRDGRVELQLDRSVVRASSNTGLSFTNLTDTTTQLQLTMGTVLVRVRQLDGPEIYEVDTPNLAFSLRRPGLYRISVNDTGDSTAIRVRSGEGEVTGGAASYPIRANESNTFAGTGALVETSGPLSGDDAFDTWAAFRDRHAESSSSARYVSADVVGYGDLDDYGAWRQIPDEGAVWFPQVTVVGWAPYRFGHWAYIAPWGYTWVDDAPWGFAPFHYGRWVFYGGAWGWVPARPPVVGVAYVRPVYAPALVAWVGGPQFGVGVSVGGPGFSTGVHVGWFPLGPREVYVPAYRVTRTYVTNVNISNTTVSTTVVNNYYNTTVVTNRTTVTNASYVNQRVAGAVTVTTSRTFTAAQPVARDIVRVEAREVVGAPVAVATPAMVPARQAVLGPGAVAVRPPAAAVTRTVVVKAVPPRPAVAAVRVAPPAAAPAPVHANDIPSSPRPVPPPASSTALDKRQEQQQEDLIAKQERERRAVQLQQEQQHAELVRKQADIARRQAIEQEHERQTQQLQQKQAEEQRKLEEKHRQERETQAKSKKGEQSQTK